MIKFDQDNGYRLSQEWRTNINPRLRAIVLGLEFFCYNKFRLRNLVIQTIRLDKPNGKEEDKHLMDPACAVDIGAVPAEHVKAIIQHALELGAAPVTMHRKDHLHLEIALKI